MPYFDTAQQWLTQSTLLLQARPTTTRITTKYNIARPIDPSNPPKSKPRKPKASTSTPATSNPTIQTTTGAPSITPAPPRDPVRATLTLKTYDPVSGATLKYKTTKAAEVGRLIHSLGRLARPMAGLPEVKETVIKAEAAAESGSGIATPVTEAVGSSTSKPGGGGAPGGQSGKKGKKGKK